VSELIETLAAELERPRELSAQVVKHVCGTYGIDGDAVGSFLAGELPKLEDYEIDLILSPVFTPKLADQALFAELLGGEPVPREQWPALIQQLAARPTRAQLVTSDNRTHSVTLREVTIERYVHRLRLDGAISESLFKQLDEVPLAADGPLLKAIARRAVWENDARRNILTQYLTNAIQRGIYRLADAVELLNLVESYRPGDAADLVARIPQWQQVLQHEINVGAGPKPFFNQRIEESHGGDRDQRRHDDARISAKQEELAQLERLQQALTG